jgi:hypothetical protein
MLRGRVLSSGNGWYHVRPGNDFVLYLRSFDDDALARFDIPRGLLKVVVPRTTVEQELMQAIKAFGPVVTLGDPRVRT